MPVYTGTVGEKGERSDVYFSLGLRHVRPPYDIILERVILHPGTSNTLVIAWTKRRHTYVCRHDGIRTMSCDRRMTSYKNVLFLVLAAAIRYCLLNELVS